MQDKPSICFSKQCNDNHPLIIICLSTCWITWIPTATRDVQERVPGFFQWVALDFTVGPGCWEQVTAADGHDLCCMRKPWCKTGWWCQTCSILHNIWDVILPIDFHIFQDGFLTTNQNMFLAKFVAFFYFYCITVQTSSSQSNRFTAWTH